MVYSDIPSLHRQISFNTTIPSTKDRLHIFETCGIKCVSVVNSLISEFMDHFESEGPLNDDWLIAKRAFGDASTEEICALKNNVRHLKETGMLNEFVNDYDRTQEMGKTTIIVCCC